MSESRKPAKPTIQLENDRVIVTEWRFAPGAETTWHQHDYDYVVVPQSTGKLHIQTETEKKELKWKQIMVVLKPQNLTVWSIGPGNFHFFSIRL